MKFEEVQLEVFLKKDFFDIYIKFEKKMKQILVGEMQRLEPEDKYRIYYYLGWKSNLKIVEYDTYSTKSEASRFDSNSSLKKFSLNDLIKLNKHEKILRSKELSLDSKNRRLESLDFNDHIKKVINMRNALAHDYNQDVSNEKYVTELLSDSQIKHELEIFYDEYKQKLELHVLTNTSRYIFSNISYLKRLDEKLNQVYNKDF